MNIELGHNVKTWNLVIAFALVLLVAVAAFDLLVPKPSVQKERVRMTSELRKAEISRDEAEEKLEELTLNPPKAFEVLPEKATPAILAEVTRLAGTSKVNVKSFRPQRPDMNGAMARLTYVVLADGTFDQAMAFAKALDASDNRIGVTQIQFASADGETDKVNVTIGIVAYAEKPKVTR